MDFHDLSLLHGFSIFFIRTVGGNALLPLHEVMCERQPKFKVYGHFTSLFQDGLPKVVGLCCLK